MSQLHFITEISNIFPEGYTLEVIRTKTEEKDNITILITGKEQNIPFRISGPEKEMTTEAIQKAIDELKKSMEQVNTNKDSWVEAVKKEVELKAEEEAKKKATSKKTPSTSTAAKKKTKEEEEREKVEKEYEEVLKSKPDKKMTVQQMEKAIKNVKSQVSMFDNEQEEDTDKSKEKKDELKETGKDFESEKPAEEPIREEQKEVPTIPGSDSDGDKQPEIIPGETAKKQEPAPEPRQDEEKKETSDEPKSDKEGSEKSFLNLGSW